LHEPDAKLRFSSDADQPGGSYSWDGQYIGAGTLTNDRFEGKERIDQILEFRRPFKSRAMVWWEFADAEGGTEVTWNMRGSMPLLFRPMIPMMREMIAKDYELGLALLRGRLDPEAEHPVIAFEGETDLDPVSALTIRFTGGMEAMVQAMEQGFPKIAAYLCEQGSAPIGAPFSAYHKVDIKNKRFDCDIAIPAAAEIASDSFKRKTFDGGKHFTVTLTGSYHFLELAWYAAVGHLRMRKLKVDKRRPMLEVYENDPTSVSDSNALRTTLYLPLR
jgi:effector-binding domain-containing protein